MNSPDVRGLRILHVQKTHGIGGSERQIVELCAGLRASGATASVLWLISPHRRPHRLLDLCRELAVPASSASIRGSLDPLVPAAIRARLAAAAAQILHLHLIHATFHGVLAVAARRSLSVVATRHGTEAYQRRPWFRLLASRLDARCARVIVPSQWVADYTRRWDRTPPEKLRVIPHGVDLERFATSAAPAQPPTTGSGERGIVTAVARLHPSKDHATLLQAFAIVCEGLAGARLQIVGDGPLRPALERLAGRLLGPALRQGRVRFLGERCDVPQILARSDLVVVPGEREGFGLAALEAMAAGLPVIAPASGALPELIRDQVNGCLVPPRDPAALAAALDALLRDPERRRALGARARETAARYPRQRMVAATAALYAELRREQRLG